MRSNILFSLLLITLVIGCNVDNKNENSNFLTVTGDKEILKNIKINLIPITKNKGDIKNDTLLVFNKGIKLKTVSAKSLRYKYLISYKDSLSILRSFDNPIRAIGKEKAKHHWHILLAENKLYANFSNKLVDTINKSSIIFLQKS